MYWWSVVCDVSCLLMHSNIYIYIYIYIYNRIRAIKTVWNMCLFILPRSSLKHINPDSNIHGANMGPTWVLSAPDGPMLAPWTLLSGKSTLPVMATCCTITWIQLAIWQFAPSYSRDYYKLPHRAEYSFFLQKTIETQLMWIFNVIKKLRTMNIWKKFLYMFRLQQYESALLRLMAWCYFAKGHH